MIVSNASSAMTFTLGLAPPIKLIQDSIEPLRHSFDLIFGVLLLIIEMERDVWSAMYLLDAPCIETRKKKYYQF